MRRRSALKVSEMGVQVMSGCGVDVGEIVAGGSRLEDSSPSQVDAVVRVIDTRRRDGDEAGY
jgi:hypothetical protein